MTMRFPPILAMWLASVVFLAANGGAEAQAPAGQTQKPARLWTEELVIHPWIPVMPVSLAPLPKGEGFLVLGRNGHLHHYSGGLEDFPVRDRKVKVPKGGWPYPLKVTAMQLPDVHGKGDLGAIGFALDPKFSANRFFYVWSVSTGDKTVGLERYTLSPDPEKILQSRATVIRFSRRDPPAPYHMGGIVQFLPDGTLLLAPGDAERPELSQDPKDLNGKFLRILPRPGQDGGYDIPKDNPYVGREDILPEIQCFGLRATFRGYLHQGRHFFFGDVGATFEEINVWSGGPVDFGWGHGPITDGPDVLKGVKPILWWTAKDDWSGEDGKYNGETRVSACLGPIYEPKSVDRYGGLLTGKLFVFDILRGWLRSATLSPELQVVGTEHLGHRQFLSHVIQGEDDWLYGLTWEKPAGIVRFRLVEP